MSDTPLDATELAGLRALDTPTVCNALELVSPGRRGFGYTDETFVCADLSLPPLVGYARTATIRSTQPGTRQGAEMREQRMAYYGYVHQAPGPTIAVVQDLDGARAGYGSFWGEVNSALHKALGCVGGITDGSIRDLAEIAPGFQLLARKVVPSHAFVHLVDFDCQVSVCGMVVRSGDLIHADRHGAVVVPHDIARDVAAAAQAVTAGEQQFLDVVRGADFTFEKLEAAYGELTKR